MNLHLKKYILNAKGNAIRLGFRLKINETAYDTIALVSNQSSEKVAMTTIMTDIMGNTKIKAYMINQKKYNWAKDEGFSLDHMLALVEERIFIEIDPHKLANHLL